MEQIKDIAKWFLSKESMTHKKLQKLCYYAQAWHCALYNEPLFEAEFQAWVHGPVSRELYGVYADYHWQDIPQEEYDSSKLGKDVINVLDAVWCTYGGFSGDQLESLTHSEAPWRIARGNAQPWEIGTEVIKTDDMKWYYRRLYEEGQND